MVRQSESGKTRRGARRRVRQARVVLALFVLMIIVARNQERILDRVRSFNKRYLNPWMLKRAEHHAVYYAMLQHTGRSSGRMYTTPVVIDLSTDGTSLFIPLPYGAKTDWCRNVLAAGRCTIDKNGVHYSVVEPQIVNAIEALPLLPARERLRWKIFGMAQFLRVRIEKPVETEQPHEPLSIVRPVQAVS